MTHSGGGGSGSGVEEPDTGARSWSRSGAVEDVRSCGAKGLWCLWCCGSSRVRDRRGDEAKVPVRWYPG